jgi:carbon storage regulator CsrA
VTRVTESASRSEQYKEVPVLVLSRKENERIICTAEDGTVIEITVIKVGRGRVSVGVEAPGIFNVRREAAKSPLQKKDK